jgi:hypothetical protein
MVDFDLELEFDVYSSDDFDVECFARVTSSNDSDDLSYDISIEYDKVYKYSDDQSKELILYNDLSVKQKQDIEWRAIELVRNYINTRPSTH